MKNRIGIFGGSFDPIHNGHVSLCVEIMESFPLDEVWIVPANTSPFKEGEKVASIKDRLAMAQLAVEEISGFKVLDIEAKRGGVSYTIDTIEDLYSEQSDRGRNEFFLILGDDAVSRFHEWRRVDDLIRKVRLLVGVRGNTQHAPEASPAIKKALTDGKISTTMIEISSTVIRERIRKNLYCGHLVHSKVLDYIAANRIYRPLTK